MFVLRSISCADGLTKNQFIGNNYTLIRKGDQLFKEKHDKFWNVEGNGGVYKSTCAFITDENDKDIPLMYDYFHYIMSASGQTFEKV